MAGYRLYENMSWPDAFLNAAMLLGGMGPVKTGGLSSQGKFFCRILRAVRRDGFHNRDECHARPGRAPGNAQVPPGGKAGLRMSTARPPGDHGCRIFMERLASSTVESTFNVIFPSVAR